MIIGRMGTNYSTANASIEEDANGTIRLKSKSGLFGTGNGDDKVQVSAIGIGMYAVDINGERHVFNQEQMSRLRIETGAGDDSVTIGPGVDGPLAVDTADGDDQLINYGNGISADLGDGDDYAVSHGHHNRIFGGEDDDRLEANGAFNSVDGGSGWNRIGVLGFENVASCAGLVTGGALVDETVGAGIFSPATRINAISYAGGVWPWRRPQ